MVRPANLLVAVFALSVAGYPIAGLLSAALDLPSTATSIPFRLLVLALSAALAGMSARGARIGAPGFVLIGLWTLYLVRLIWDFGQDVEGIDRALPTYIAVVLIPGVAMLVGARHWNDHLAARSLFALTVSVSAGAILMDATGVAGSRSLAEATGRLSLDTLNPISIGHVGVTGLLAALVLSTQRTTLPRKVVLLIGSAVCLFAQIQSGSKSPLLALLAAICLLMLTRRLQPIVPTLAVLGVGAVAVLGDTAVTERLANLEKDPSTAARLELLDDALRQIALAPFAGSAYVELTSGDYPHNILVETLMALGLPIGALLVGLTGWVAWRLLRTRSGNVTMLAAMFAQYLVAALLSGAFFASVSFWAPLAVLCIRLNGTRWQPRTQLAAAALGTGPLPTGARKKQD